jgi:hypothetical protein
MSVPALVQKMLLVTAAPAGIAVIVAVAAIVAVDEAGFATTRYEFVVVPALATASSILMPPRHSSSCCCGC